MSRALTTRLWATGAALALALAGLIAVPAAAENPANPQEEPVPVATTPPAVIPALDTWQEADGQWTLTEQVRVVAPEEFQFQATTLAEELSLYLDPSKAGTALTPPTPSAVPVVTDGASPTDIRVVIDDAQQGQLGDEGYTLAVAPEGVTITAADERGAFYGTRSLSQMLRQTKTIPAGQVTDTPKMEERGVTLCACRINIQTDFIDRLLMDMSDLKLNYLMLELKIKSDDPRDNLWSYYTRDDVRSLVEKAGKYGIQVFPVINAPGHMGAWLANHPELQLKDNSGTAQETRLDITHPDAVKFYTDIIDSYADVFPSAYWHMGADEYLINTSGPSQFTAVGEWAKEQFGPNATLYDAFNNFVNQVNAHVKAQGKTLRMWNDGIHATQEVQLDDDIVIEYWHDTGIHATDFAEQGYQLMNASQSLYFSRSAKVYKVNSQQLWNSNWNAGKFSGGTELPVDSPSLRGAKVSIWPDTSYHQTENEVEVEVFDSLRLVSQLTWNANHLGNDGQEQSWETFKQGIDDIGHHPLWQNVVREPLEEGSYTISLGEGQTQQALVSDGNAVALGNGSEQWKLLKSPDHYYQLRHEASGKCLALREGNKDLGVVIEVGATPQLEDCVDITNVNYDNGEQGNPQKWQLIATDGGFIIRNALTNQDLSSIKGNEKAIDFSANPQDDEELNDQSLRPATGTIVQLPHDLSVDIWRIAALAGASASISPAEVTPAKASTLTVTVRAASNEALTNVVVTPGELEGLSVRPLSRRIDRIPAGEQTSVTFDVYTDGVADFIDLPIHVTHAKGTLETSAEFATQCGPRTTPTSYEASSEEKAGEPAPNGPIAAAFDGNPATYWHTQWQGTEPTHPHTVTIDLGEAKDVCAFDYLPRTSGNGRITDYEIHVSNDAQSWGEPVAHGTFRTTAEWQSVELPEVHARYVRLTTLGSVTQDDEAGAKWASAAEFGLRLAETPIEVPDPSADPSPSAPPTIVTPTNPVPTPQKPKPGLPKSGR